MLPSRVRPGLACASAPPALPWLLLAAALVGPAAAASDGGTPRPSVEAGAALEPRGAVQDGPALLVVDREGRPVPGVALSFVDRLAGTSLAARLPGGDRSDDRGWLRWAPGDEPRALDVRCGDPEWAVAFVHAERVPDEGPADLERTATLDLTRPAVCVLERTGTVAIEVLGAAPGDRFHATWTDVRPEPASHRGARGSTSFTGSRGRLRARPGRGTLYVTREGHLGASALRGGAPLLVSVVAGETSTVRVRLEEGPVTTFLAPFDTIQFSRLQALGPDGELVVADLPFEASPLRVPSVVPVSDGGGADGGPGPRPRLPRHLMRAVDGSAGLSPLGAPRPGPGDREPSRPGVERAPVLVVFPVDLGGKLRFPEVEQGWIRLAQQGNQFLTAQPFWLLPGAQPLRSAPGEAHLDRLFTGAPNRFDVRSGVALVRSVDAAGDPAPHREVLVTSGPLPAFRAITDARGELRVRGAVTDEVTVVALESLACRATARVGAEAAALAVEPAAATVRGRWRGATPSGRVLVMTRTGDGDSTAVPLGTRAAGLCTVDADGRFCFAPMAAGVYELRGEGLAPREVTVPAEGEVELTLATDGDGAPAQGRR